MIDRITEIILNWHGVNMASVAYEVIAATGKYKQNGEEKTRFTKIGVAIQTDKGLRLKLETIPVAWDGWAMLSEPKQKQGNGSRMDDSIP